MKILNVDTEKRRLGTLGERRAALYLFLRGYRILARNVDSGAAEVDIVAKKGDKLIFVEVKTRSIESQSPNEPRPASSVTPEKQWKIFDVAIQYQGIHSEKLSGLGKRFDIIEVLVKKKKRGYRVVKINHLISAFDKSTAKRPPWKR